MLFSFGLVIMDDTVLGYRISQYCSKTQRPSSLENGSTLELAIHNQQSVSAEIKVLLGMVISGTRQEPQRLCEKQIHYIAYSSFVV